VTLRPKRKKLAVGLAVAFAFVAVGWWISGVVGWICIVGAGGLGVYGLYQFVTRRPGLTLTETGLAWPGGSLRWNEAASFRELAWRQGLMRARFLGIETVGHVKGSRGDRGLLGVDFSVNLTPLERSPEEIFVLVEAYSGLPVQRIP
jgi:hypothetical protein